MNGEMEGRENYRLTMLYQQVLVVVMERGTWHKRDTYGWVKSSYGYHYYCTQMHVSFGIILLRVILVAHNYLIISDAV